MSTLCNCVHVVFSAYDSMCILMYFYTRKTKMQFTVLWLCFYRINDTIHYSSQRPLCSQPQLEVDVGEIFFANYFCLTQFMRMKMIYVVGNAILIDKNMKVKTIQHYNQENLRIWTWPQLLITWKTKELQSPIIKLM